MGLRRCGDGIAVDGSVGYGELAVNELGYESTETGIELPVPHRFKADYAVSAHAPSVLMLRTERPVAIAGYAAPSFFGRRCWCWVDDHAIGHLDERCDVTAFVRLPPGEFRLTIAPEGPNTCCHTAWLLRTDIECPRLALVTVGCFSESDLPHQLYWLYRTAARFGILVHVHGVGEQLGNWFTRKIETMRRFIAGLPGVYSHVLYLDGSDSIVLAEESEIIERLQSATIGAENCSWPVRDGAWENYWRTRFPDGIGCFPQAAAWGGPRDEILHVLDQLIAWHYRAKDGRAPPWAFRDGAPLASWWDDQFIWQAAIRDGLPIRMDHRWEVFAQMACTGTQLSADPQRVHSDGTRIITPHGTRPIAAHFSTPGRRFIPVWAKFMGL